MTKRETTGLRTVPPLIRQTHGGALRAGGTPGNRGGTGAPSSELRARLRGSASERVAIAEEIADDPQASNADRLRAIDLLFKYGLGAAEDEAKAVTVGQLHLSALQAPRHIEAVGAMQSDGGCLRGSSQAEPSIGHTCGTPISDCHGARRLAAHYANTMTGDSV